MAGRPDLTFQEGVPGDFDLAVFTLGPLRALRHRRAFTEATLAEIRDVRALTGAATLFQIEVPVELVLLARAPAAARPGLARALARNEGQERTESVSDLRPGCVVERLQHVHGLSSDQIGEQQ